MCLMCIHPRAKPARVYPGSRRGEQSLRSELVKAWRNWVASCISSDIHSPGLRSHGSLPDEPKIPMTWVRYDETLVQRKGKTGKAQGVDADAGVNRNGRGKNRAPPPTLLYKWEITHLCRSQTRDVASIFLYHGSSPVGPLWIVFPAANF